MPPQILGYVLPRCRLIFAADTSEVSEPDVSTYAAAFPIVDGYVAFGDSFAAGMGTGTTTGDACRVGENSYPKLLNEYGKTPTSDFQNLPCSGDTVVGLMSQIDKWITPEKADVATISIGGNDVGFSKIVVSSRCPGRGALEFWRCSSISSSILSGSMGALLSSIPTGKAVKWHSFHPIYRSE